jgi:LytS/YehU family sensor histidine kinase
MMIQPLVENAIWHGLLPKKDNRRLSIHFKYIDKKMLTCIIDDNGVGCRKKKPEETVSKRRSLAISFIYQRLELMGREWKRDFNIKIIDKKNEDATSAGTQVIIHLPILN